MKHWRDDGAVRSAIARIVDNPDKSRLLLVITFFLSRLVIYLSRPFLILGDMHLVPRELLSNDLLNTIRFLHSQPPLYNLAFGALYKLVPPAYERMVLHAVFFLLGLGIVLLTHALMDELGVRPRLAFIGTLVLCVYPSMIQGETWVNYSYPSALLLVMTVYSCARFFRTERWSFFAQAQVSMWALSWLRASFHLLFWMLPLSMVLLWFAKHRGLRLQRYAWTAAVALLITGSLYFRNAVQYGMFTASTWLGFNIAGMTRYVSEPEIATLVQEGTVTPIVWLPRFAYATTYAHYYGEAQPKPTGVRILDARPEAPSTTDLYSLLALKASKEYQTNTLRIIRRYPIAYLKAVLNEMYLFLGFSPYRYFSSPEERRKFLVPRTDTWLHVVRDITTVYIVPPVMFLLFTAVLAGLWVGIVRSLREPSKEAISTAFLCGIVFFNLMYVFLVSSTMELSEGNYYRICIDPLILAGFMKAIAVWRR